MLLPLCLLCFLLFRINWAGYIDLELINLPMEGFICSDTKRITIRSKSRSPGSRIRPSGPGSIGRTIRGNDRNDAVPLSRIQLSWRRKI